VELAYINPTGFEKFLLEYITQEAGDGCGMPDDQVCGAGVYSPGHNLLDIGRTIKKI